MNEESQNAPTVEVGAPLREPILSADFIVTTVANFFGALSQQMLTATLPLYVLAIGGSQADVGLVSGMLALTALFLRPPVGYLADSWRKRPLILTGLFSYGLASVSYLFANSVPFLLLGRVIHGFGLSNYTTASSAYIADIVPSTRRAEAVGIFSSAQSIGLIVGPAIGFTIVASFGGFHTLFLVTSSLSFIAFFISFFARERARHYSGPRKPWSIKTGIIAMEAWPIAWMALWLGFGFGPLGTFIAIFSQERGMPNPGIFFTVQAITLLISRPFAGRLADRRGRSFVIVPGLIIVAISLILLPFCYGVLPFLFVAALFGIGFGGTQPAIMALLVDTVLPEKRGIAMSTYFLGFDLGISFGTIGLGLVGQAYGLAVMWPFSAGAMLLGLFGLLWIKKPPKTAPVA